MSRVIGLNLNQSGWSLVEVIGAGVSEKIGVVQKTAWHSKDPGGRGTELRRAWLEHRLPRCVTVSLPIYHGFLTTLTLPPLPERDIPAAIRGAMDTSVADGDDWLAFDVLDRGEKLKVQVGVLKAAEMAPWVELLEAAGIEPEGFVLQATAVASALVSNEETSVFALASDDIFEIGLAMSGVPALWRAIPLIGEAWETEIIRELNFTRLAWAKAGGKEPTEIIVLGLDGKDSSMSWAESWGTRKLSLSDGKTHFDGDLSLIAAYGAARSGDSRGIVWRTESASKIQRESLQVWIRIAASALLILAGVFFFYQAHIQRIEVEKQWVRDNQPLYQELEAIQNHDGQLASELQKNRSRWEERYQYSLYLEEWQKTVPEGTVLSGCSIEGFRVIELTGRTPFVTVLLKRLEKNRRFQDLVLKGPIIHNPKGWDEFKLSGKLRKEAGTWKQN